MCKAQALTLPTERTYPTAYRGVGNIVIYSQSWIANGTEKRECRHVKTARSVPFLWGSDISNGLNYSSFIPLNCAERAASPPRVLVPVSSLTTTSVSFVNTPKPSSVAAEKASPSSPLSAPTVLPTVRPNGSSTSAAAGPEPQVEASTQVGPSTTSYINYFQPKIKTPVDIPIQILTNSGSSSQIPDSLGLPTQPVASSSEPIERDSQAVASASDDVSSKTDRPMRTLTSETAADQMTPTFIQPLDRNAPTQQPDGQVPPTSDRSPALVTPISLEPAGPVIPSSDRSPGLMTPISDELPEQITPTFVRPFDQTPPTNDLLAPTSENPSRPVLPKIVFVTPVPHESSQSTQVLRSVRTSQPIQATSKPLQVSQPTQAGSQPTQAISQPIQATSQSQPSGRAHDISPIDLISEAPVSSHSSSATNEPVPVFSTVLIPQGRQTLLAINSSVVTAASDGKFIVADQTILPEGLTISVLDKAVYIPSADSNAVIDQSTMNLIPAPKALTMKNQIAATAISGEYVIENQTLIPKAPSVTVSGNVVALDSSRTALLIKHNGETAQSGPIPTLSPLVIEGQTLVADGLGIILNRTSVLLTPEGDSLIIGTKTDAFVALTTQTDLKRLIVDDLKNPKITTSMVIDRQTLVSDGPAIFLFETAVSLVSEGSTVVTGIKTEDLGALATPTGVASLIAAALKSSEATAPLLIGGQTLSPGGPAVSLLGTPVSLAPQGSLIVIGTQTEALTALATETGLGGLIAGAFDGAVPGVHAAEGGSNVTRSNHSASGDFPYYTGAGAGRKLGLGRSLPSSSCALAVVVFLSGWIL